MFVGPRRELLGLTEHNAWSVDLLSCTACPDRLYEQGMCWRDFRDADGIPRLRAEGTGRQSHGYLQGEPLRLIVIALHVL